VRFSIRLQKRAQKEGDTYTSSIFGAYSNIRFIKMEALENLFLDKIVSSMMKKRWTLF